MQIAADVDLLQFDLVKLNDWIKTWLLSLNKNKCKVVSYGRTIKWDSHYKIDDVVLEKLDKIKDLGVIFDTKLRFNYHINEKVNKTYSILGIIKRNFNFFSGTNFCIVI